MQIVQNLNEIYQRLWAEECYMALNVIYKASKNPKKLIDALNKHKKKLLKYAEEYIVSESEDYILSQTRMAFSAIKGYYEENVNVEQIRRSIEPAIMIQRMLSKAKEIFDNHLVVDQFSCNGDLCAEIRSYAVFDYLKAILSSSPNDYNISADVLCAADYGAPQKRMRFVVMGIKKSLADEVKLPQGSFTEENYRTVRDAIQDLEGVPTVYDAAKDAGTVLDDVQNVSDLGKLLRDTDVLKNHIITNTRETALERFRALKQGQNFHALDESLKTNTYTDVSRTQNTIYCRLDYDQPSGTVVNVRKSMWVHPVFDRAVSVREAARLQTFPDSFIFYGTKDKQYQQVGNAVPPIMAKAIAKKLAQQLKKSEANLDKSDG
jgi:DNA (cytosine-5)-methyltransferase 1